MFFRRTDLLSKVHRPKAKYTRIDGNYYNQAMAMFRFTRLFTKEDACLHICIQLFVHLLSCFLECCMQSKTFASFRFKFNEIDQRVIFIATSDDPKWVKANLRGVNDDLYFSADLFSGVNKINWCKWLVRKTFGQNPQNFRTKSAELSLSYRIYAYLSLSWLS